MQLIWQEHFDLFIQARWTIRSPVVTTKLFFFNSIGNGTVSKRDGYWFRESLCFGYQNSRAALDFFSAAEFGTGASLSIFCTSGFVAAALLAVFPAASFGGASTCNIRVILVLHCRRLWPGFRIPRSAALQQVGCRKDEASINVVCPAVVFRHVRLHIYFVKFQEWNRRPMFHFHENEDVDLLFLLSTEKLPLFSLR